MKQLLNLQLPKCPEDRICLVYGLGLLGYFLLYLALLGYTLYEFMSHPSSVAPAQLVTGYLSVKQTRKIRGFITTKMIVR